MQRNSISTDRRRHKRFKMPADAFAIVKTPRFKIGQITDMSLGGVACCYLEHPFQYDRTFEMAIFLADDGFYLGQLNVSLVTHVELEDSSANEGDTSMKRCGFRFEHLTSMQRSKIQNFMPKHASGFVKDYRSIAKESV